MIKMMMALKDNREDCWKKEDEDTQEGPDPRLSSAEQRIVAYGKYPFYRPENGQAWLPKQARHPVVG
jgi:hypothetical protein